MKTCLVALAAVTMALAQDAETPSWEGFLSVGGLFTSGNTEVCQIDTGLEIGRRLAGQRFRGDLEASASYGSRDGEAYLEKYRSTLTFIFTMTGNNYATAGGYWTRDEFTGIGHEWGITAGLGRKLVRTGSLTVSMEAGAGLLNRENTDGETLETSAGYTGLDFELLPGGSWTLAESFRFTTDFQDSDNYSMESVLEANSSITGSLSLVTGYDVVFHNVPPVEGNEKTDTSLRVQLRLGI
ncbi:MAG: hypothetical protein AVO35_08910 [Candidatus Aegiribacteria sp. MLS_C]|nr:MAG: hypothetical protein AVO35_08910 [Candidatus Aegiribacteria sp. MLS_C]